MDQYGVVPLRYQVTSKTKRFTKKTFSQLDKINVTRLFRLALTTGRQMLAISCAAELINSGAFNSVWEIIIEVIISQMIYSPSSICLAIYGFNTMIYLDKLKKYYKISFNDLRNHQEVRNAVTQMVGVITHIHSVRKDDTYESIVQIPDEPPGVIIVTNNSYCQAKDLVTMNKKADPEDNLVIAISQLIEHNKRESKTLQTKKIVMFWTYYLSRHIEYFVPSLNTDGHGKHLPKEDHIKINKYIEERPIWTIWKYCRQKFMNNAEHSKIFANLCELMSWLLTRKTQIMTQVSTAYLTASLIFVTQHDCLKYNDDWRKKLFSKDVIQLTMKTNVIFNQTGRLITLFNKPDTEDSKDDIDN